MQKIRDMIDGLSERDRKLLLVVVVFMVLFVFVKFVLLVQIESYQSRDEELQKMTETRDQLRTKSTKQKSEAEKVVAAKKRLEDIKAVLDRNYENGSALMLLSDNAYEWQVYISSINPKERIVTEHYIELPISITVRGVYRNSLKFINDLENSGGVVQIKKLSMAIAKVELQRPVEIDSSEEKELPPVGRNILLDSNLDISFYAVPGSEKDLTEKIFKINQWTKGRGVESFIYPGPVSPHSSLLPGGDMNIPGLTFKKDVKKSPETPVKLPEETGAKANPVPQNTVESSGSGATLPKNQ